MQEHPKIITSVAPYVTIANALEAIHFAHEDGFSGIELSEDHLHCLVQIKPKCLQLMREYSTDKHMINSLHRTLFRPSIDSENQAERKRAVEYACKTLDYMEAGGILRMVMHSFSDLPGFFNAKSERANKVGYVLGCSVVQVYGILAPALKAYRQLRKEKIETCFMHSLAEIAKYAAEKKVGGKPIEIVFEEHYSDAIDYDSIPYGKGNFANVIRGIDTAHQLIRTGENTDLSEIFEPIHFHAVDTNGIIDDHRTIGKGKVTFENSISHIIKKRLTDTLILENGTRKSALKSKMILMSMIKRC
ncbi:MAG: sugar phosphate isomerase/epimerase [Thermoproteota archaeon]|nr:sugar phosphate isomerase/epimerase [Thermoproteota archaeon]